MSNEFILLRFGDGRGDLPHPDAADADLQKEDPKPADPLLFVLYPLCGAGGDDLPGDLELDRFAPLGGGGVAGGVGDRLFRSGPPAGSAPFLRRGIHLRTDYEVKKDPRGGLFYLSSWRSKAGLMR